MRKKRRTIAQIADDLAAALKRESADIIADRRPADRGQGPARPRRLAAVARGQLRLERSTADNYMSAASFAAKLPNGWQFEAAADRALFARQQTR